MAIRKNMMQTQKEISRIELEKILFRIFDAVHVNRENSHYIVDTLIQAEQWGVTSHCVLRVEHYIRCLQSGGILPPFTVEQQSGGWVRASVNDGLGISASCKATDFPSWLNAWPVFCPVLP